MSWITILRKRPAYRKAFDRFDPKKVARYDAAKKRALMRDAGIVRNRLKIDAAVTNAQAFLDVQKEFGSFDAYVWQFVGGRSRCAEDSSEIAQGHSGSRTEICYAFSRPGQ